VIKLSSLSISKVGIIYLFNSFIIGLPVMISIIVLLNSLFVTLEIGSLVDTMYGISLFIIISFVIALKMTEYLTEELVRYLQN